MRRLQNALTQALRNWMAVLDGTTLADLVAPPEGSGPRAVRLSVAQLFGRRD